MPVLSQAFEMAVGQDGWARLDVMGNAIYQVDPGFDPRTYGFRKLSDLVRQSGAFEIDEAEGEPMRLKAKAAAVAATAPRARAPRRRRNTP